MQPEAVSMTKGELGQKLKERRCALNRSISEMTQLTGIKPEYIEAIELGLIDQALSPTYARGFTKQYASALGLSAEKLLRENHIVFDGFKREFSYGISSVEARSIKVANGRLKPTIVWGGLTLLAGGVVWFFLRLIG